MNLKLRYNVILIVLLLSSLLLAAGTTDHRTYPGGQDEEDLKVQEDITAAPPGTDRRSIKTSVLRDHFKMKDAESNVTDKHDDEEYE